MYCFSFYICAFCTPKIELTLAIVNAEWPWAGRPTFDLWHSTASGAVVTAGGGTGGVGGEGGQSNALKPSFLCPPPWFHMTRCLMIWHSDQYIFKDWLHKWAVRGMGDISGWTKQGFLWSSSAVLTIERLPSWWTRAGLSPENNKAISDQNIFSPHGSLLEEL